MSALLDQMKTLKKKSEQGERRSIDVLNSWFDQPAAFADMDEKAKKKAAKQTFAERRAIKKAQRERDKQLVLEADKDINAIGERKKFVVAKGKRANAYAMSEAFLALVLNVRQGVPETQALRIVAKAYKGTIIEYLMNDAAELMELGQTFQQALVAQDDIPETMRGMISAGTTSKDVYDNIERAAELLIGATEVKEEIRKQMIVPAWSLVMIAIVILVFANFSLPALRDAMSTLGSDKPASMIFAETTITIMKWAIYILIPSGLLWVGFWYLIGRKFKPIRYAVSWLWMKAPIVGDILRTNASARLYQLFASNLSTGMSEKDALRKASRGCGEDALERDILRFVDLMESDTPPLTREFAESKWIPTIYGSLVMSTRTSSAMIDAMKQAYPKMEAKANRETDRLTTTLQPLINILSYGLLGFVLIIMLIPVYEPLKTLMTIGV